jgi:serine protease Do
MSAFPKLFAGRNRAYSSLLLLSLVGLLPLNSAMAQTREPSRSATVLRELNEAVEDLVQRVSPTVVQILVTGYGAAEETERGQADVLVGRRRAIGSGVIVDPQGYIITNAHVVNGAQNIEVLVPPPPAPTASGAAPDELQGRSYQARVVGASREIDLAVIKIDGHGLPALSISSSMPPARQGEMVFAFGSPEGLRNTVTMGVVSAVA